MRRTISFALLILLAATFTLSAEPELAPPPRVSTSTAPDGYRTVETAVVAKIIASAAIKENTGYLGVTVVRNDKGLPVVEDVQSDSPAAKAGMKKGDIVAQVGEHVVKTPTAFREWLQTFRPGEVVKFTLLRDVAPMIAGRGFGRRAARNANE